MYIYIYLQKVREKNQKKKKKHTLGELESCRTIKLGRGNDGRLRRVEGLAGVVLAIPEDVQQLRVGGVVRPGEGLCPHVGVKDTAGNAVAKVGRVVEAEDCRRRRREDARVGGRRRG